MDWQRKNYRICYTSSTELDDILEKRRKPLKRKHSYSKSNFS